MSFSIHACPLRTVRQASAEKHYPIPLRIPNFPTMSRVTKREALEKIESVGLAGSSHILPGDDTGPRGLECTSVGFQELPADELGRVIHANNLILKHDNVFEPVWLEDSPRRTARLQELAAKEVGEAANFDTLLELFKDEQGFAASINRHQHGSNDSNTLFNVVYNITERKGIISMGRPTQIEEQIEIGFPKLAE